MTKRDLRVIPYKEDGIVGFDVQYFYKGDLYYVTVRQVYGIIRVYYSFYHDDTIEFLDIYTRALRVASKLVKKLEKTK